MERQIAMSWDAALRRGDLLELDLNWLRQGTFTIVQNKTKSRMVCRLNPSTLELIESIGEEPGRLAFPLWAGSDRRTKLSKQLMRNAVLDSPRGQFFRKIRRSSIAHVESICKGTGWIQGGRTDPKITNWQFLIIESA